MAIIASVLSPLCWKMHKHWLSILWTQESWFATVTGLVRSWPLAAWPHLICLAGTNQVRGRRNFPMLFSCNPLFSLLFSSSAVPQSAVSVNSGGVGCTCGPLCLMPSDGVFSTVFRVEKVSLLCIQSHKSLVLYVKNHGSCPTNNKLVRPGVKPKKANCLEL